MSLSATLQLFSLCGEISAEVTSKFKMLGLPASIYVHLLHFNIFFFFKRTFSPRLVFGLETCCMRVCSLFFGLRRKVN